MDHLPCPASAIGKEITFVPYVCQEEYDGGPFMTYPSRTGGFPDLHTVGLFPGQLPYSHQMQLALLSKSELESFYQTWLFFGLIHEILGDLYVPANFIYTCEDQCGITKAVSTSKLITALEKWVTLVQAGRVDPSVTYAHVAQCLCLAHAALAIPAIRSKFDPDIKLSLASLGQTFTYAAKKAFNMTDSTQDDKCPSTWRQLTDDDYWKRRLLLHGWCVTEITLILDTISSLQTLHFLACLDKTGAEHSHHGCDKQQCMVYQNDLGHYQTQHVSKECRCTELSIDPDALHNILKTEAVPLIRVNRSQTLGELSIDIFPSRPTSRYVALSHVWADGLGNPHANALPRCQLFNLGKIVREMNISARSRDVQDHRANGKGVEENEEDNEDILIWCDTLCCPVGPEEAKHLALESMYRTYQNATHCLVLDAFIRQYNVESLDMDEVSMRILTSPWMRRLWTLQEGALPALANRLWFQLAHKAVNLRELRINARDKYFSSIGRRGLAGDMLRRIGSFANMFLEDNCTPPRADLGKVIDALHHRSVSILSDEPLLIGNLLGLDAAQILNGGDGAIGQRINRLWRLLPSAVDGIPKNLLFRVGPRLSEPGLRWAPATLLIDNVVNIAIQSSDKEEDQAFLTPSDGLFVRLHGFRLSLASRAKGLPSPHESSAQLHRPDSPNGLWMKDDFGSWYLIQRRLPVEKDKFLTDKTLTEVVLKGENLWVVHPDPEFPRPPESTAQSSAGLIVEVKTGENAAKDETAVKKAHAQLHITMAPVKTSTSAWFAIATACSAQLASDSPALRKLAATEHGLDENSSSSPSLKTAALGELASEIHQLATNKETEKAMAAKGNGFNASLMEEVITLVVLGQYVCMGENMPKSQQWCVD